MTWYNYFGKEALAGGLNVSDNPLILGSAELSEADNILISQTLARRKRPGMVDYHLGSFVGTASYPASGIPIRGITQFWRYPSGVSTATSDIVLHQSTKVWRIRDRTNAAVNLTSSLTLDPTSTPSYQAFQGTLFFSSTALADGYNKIDGFTTANPTAAQVATAPPDGPGKFLATFNGRMIMAGNGNFPFRVYVSQALNAEVWSGPDTTSFDLDYDGDPSGVTAIFPQLQGRLYIATETSIYELTVGDASDVSTYSIVRVGQGVGCVGHGTVVATPNDILFFSRRGAHSLRKTITSDQTEATFLSRDIQRLITDALAPDLLYRAESIWDEKQNLYITTCASSGQTTNDTVLVYNITAGLWTTWSGINARSMARLKLNSDYFPLLGGENGLVRYLSPTATDDAGTGFSANFKTGKLVPGGNIFFQKQFKSIGILCSSTKSSQVNITWSIDSIDGAKGGSQSISIGNKGDTLGTTFVLGASKLGVGAFLPQLVTVDDYGFNIQLEVSVTGDSDIEFYGFCIELEESTETYGGI